MPRSGVVPRRTLAFVVAALAATALPVTAAPQGRLGERFTATTPRQTPGLPDLDRIDPPRYKARAPEHVQVASRDKTTQIWVDFVRPDVPKGTRVPTILMASPYFNTLGRGIHGECKKPHQSPPGGLPGSPGQLNSDCNLRQTAFPEWYDEYFVPRGYAFAAMDLRGTRNSSGCQVYGDRDEVFDAVDVIDWIADQPWSNGLVGMTGGSYDGTIAIGAAVEQPISGRHKDALAAVIPIRAIDRWYDYHFFNGVQSSGHALTPALFTAELAAGDVQNSGTDDLLFPVHVAERRACIATLGLATDAGYASPYQDADAAFWAERDFVKDAAKTRAAVFLIHGLFDFNVKTNNAGHLWSALPPKLPKRLWLFNGNHADPRCWDEDSCTGDQTHLAQFHFADRFVEWSHRWFLQFLKGRPAGATAGPPVEVQRHDGRWESSPRFPASTRDLVVRAEPEDDEPTVTWSDGAESTEWSFVTTPFRSATRLSGQIAFDLALAAQGPDTTVAVRVDTIPPGHPDDADVDDPWYDGEWDGALTVTYGWVRAFYRDSVKARGRSTPSGGEPLTPGETVRLSFPSLYTDVVIPKGHRLRFTFSPSEGGTLPALTGGEVALDLTRSTIRLPVAPTRYR